MKGWKWRK